MHRNASRGILLKLVQTLFFSLMYAAIKLAGPAVPVGEVIFFRCFLALLPLAVFAWMFSDLGAMVRTQRPWSHVLRSLAGSTSMFFNFSAVQLLPLATVTAFGFLSPVFVVMLAIPLLGEKVGPWRWAAVLVGLFGVLLMLQPHGGMTALVGLHLSKGVACALVFAFLSALIVILIRQMSRTERSEAIVFYFMAWGAVFGAVLMIWHRIPLTWHEAGWLIVSGILGGFGQIFMTYCYRYAEPSLLAPFEYTSMVWAVGLGWFVLGEMPEAMVLLGAAVVISAGLVIVWREKRHRLARPPKAAE
jgi:drug/metabolite transporter (DMT)-like permease